MFPLGIIFIRTFNLHNFYVDGKAPTDDSSSYETEVDHYKSIVFNATTARLIYNLTQTRSLKAAVSLQNSIRMLSLKKWHAK